MTEGLEARGGPGMFLCGQTGTFKHSRCEECAECIADNHGFCEHCETECPPWEPDETSDTVTK